MARKGGNAKTPSHRCLVDLSILTPKEDRTIRLGPGSVLGHQEFSQLLADGIVRADCFEDLVESAEPETEAQAEPEKGEE